MDRTIVQTGEGVRSADLLLAERAAMVGLAKLASALLGSSTIANGLACTPGTGLHVVVGVGEIYSPAVTDATGYGSLSSDSHSILKQGILADPVTLSTPAPGTGGQSINYLVEVQFQENDTTSTSVPFYDAGNPTVPAFSNINTIRADVCAVQIKAGTPAATGSQTTPAADAGWTGLWVVTVANGDTSISGGQIAKLTGAPFLAGSVQDVPKNVQNQTWVYAGTAGGSANALTASLSPASAALVTGMAIELKIASLNTGAATLNLDGHGAVAIRTLDGNPLTGNELSAGMLTRLKYDGSVWQVAELSPAFLVGQSQGTSRFVKAASFLYHSPDHLDYDGVSDIDTAGGSTTPKLWLLPFNYRGNIDSVSAYIPGGLTGVHALFGLYSADANGNPLTLLRTSSSIALGGPAGTVDGPFSTYANDDIVWAGFMIEQSGVHLAKGTPNALAAGLLGCSAPLSSGTPLGFACYSKIVGPYASGLPASLSGLTVESAGAPLIAVRAA